MKTDKTVAAKAIIAIATDPQKGYEDKQVEIEAWIVQIYNEGKAIGVRNATPKNLRE